MKGLRGVEQLLNQLAAYAVVINISFLTPCFVHHAKPPVFREGTLVPSFM